MQIGRKVPPRVRRRHGGTQRIGVFHQWLYISRLRKKWISDLRRIPGWLKKNSRNVGPESTSGWAAAVVTAWPAGEFVPSAAGTGAGGGRILGTGGGEALSGAWIAWSWIQYRYPSADILLGTGKLTEAKMTALQNPKKAGTRRAILVLLSLNNPMTTCALKIQESETPNMTMVHTEIPDWTDGVRVDSICRTRRRRRVSWIREANVASDHQLLLCVHQARDLQLTDFRQKSSIRTPLPFSNPTATPHWSAMMTPPSPSPSQ
jgi:hypothetical protein